MNPKRYLTISEALIVISEMGTYTKDELIERIGQEMCKTLMTLGYLSLNYTRTDQLSLQQRLQSEPTHEEKRLAYIITHR